MNKQVSFEIAKLLKEKGFNKPCFHAYKEFETPVLYIHQDKKYNNSFKKEWRNTTRKNSQMDNAVINRYSAPTVAEVLTWLYEEQHIWIVVIPTACCYFTYKILDVQCDPSNIIERPPFNGVCAFDYNSPFESYEAAIIDILKNLIKDV